MAKIWKVKQKAPDDFVKQFPEYDSVVLQLLYNRGFNDQDKIDEFFNPDYSQDLHDPFLFKDMDRAVERILLAVKNKERVGIFGDYDADGVTSSVLLTELFKKIGLTGQVYIPDRAREGYGLNKKAIDWLAKKDIKLIVTCDCGVSNKEEIDYANEKYNIDCVVFDHHHVPIKFDKNYIIVDAKREEDKYPFKELAAVGVVFKLAQALRVYTNSPRVARMDSNSVLDDAFEKKLLDLVTIGTIADCCPIVGENRTLVKYGMEILEKTERLGLKKMFEIGRVDKENIDVYKIGFMIAPRINAAGRMDRASAAYMLLITGDVGRADQLARKIEQDNGRRQTLTSKLVEEAKEKIGDIKDKKVLMAMGWKWPLGVVGIVAGKICEEFNRPCLIGGKGLTESVGSARSIPGFNVIEAIGSCKDILLEFGGHKQAAGFSVKNENLDEFYNRLEKIADKKLSDDDLQPMIEVDAKVDFKDVSWDLYEKLLCFEPHGIGNQKPVFMAKNMQVLNAYGVGADKKHLKMKIKSDSGGKIFDVIGFNHGHRIEELQGNGKMDVVFELDVNEWNGERMLQLRLVDFRV